MPQWFDDFTNFAGRQFGRAYDYLEGGDRNQASRAELAVQDAMSPRVRGAYYQGLEMSADPRIAGFAPGRMPPQSPALGDVFRVSGQPSMQNYRDSGRDSGRPMSLEMVPRDAFEAAALRTAQPFRRNR
jgi:hypothetical protein